jgi:hypothetical protein
MFERWDVYTSGAQADGEKKAHLELNVTRTPCLEFCTPKIVDAKQGKDWSGSSKFPDGWNLDVTVNSMSLYHGAGERKDGEAFARRKASIQALHDLVQAGVRLGIWTPASESLITAWEQQELKMYPADGSIMAPPTRDELREANIKLYKVLKQLVYQPGVMGEKEYEEMLVEMPSPSGGPKRKVIRIPFAR